jgi:hypothetical protein
VIVRRATRDEIRVEPHFGDEPTEIASSRKTLSRQAAGYAST